jgi:hypothetical protein
MVKIGMKKKEYVHLSRRREGKRAESALIVAEGWVERYLVRKDSSESNSIMLSTRCVR